jgi:HEAT repeat protein
VGKVIRRYRNPSFKRINLKDPRLAAEFLYDKTDALIYIAKEWGGPESRFQATLAANELGLLRDRRFILNDLNSEDFNVRLSAVACLAFLSSPNNTRIFKKTATSDTDAGVRQSALWAYGLTEKLNAHKFLQKRIFKDRSVKVREFAKRLASQHSENWFDL